MTKSTLAILTLLLAGCATRVVRVQIVPVTALESSSRPNIVSVGMKDSTTVEFDRDLGWFNERARLIEGRDIAGAKVQLGVDSVRAVTIVAEEQEGDHGSIGPWGQTDWLPLIVFGVIAVAAFVYTVVQLPF